MSDTPSPDHRFMNRIRLVNGIAALVATALLIVVLVQVPWTTTVTYNRLAREFSVPVYSLVAIPIVLAITWWRGKTPASAPAPTRPQKIVAIAIVVPFLVLFLGAQAVLAHAYLAAGGAL